MRTAWLTPIAVVLLCSALAAQQGPNPITNGGFEKLNADGWAVDWSPVGSEVALTDDAHSGKHALLLRRTEDAIQRKVETGLNRGWTPDSGEQGAMIAEVKGGVSFWYKVPEAPADAHLRFYMIPMSADPFENTGGQREWMEVPADHFGDGQWHRGLLGYDFTDNEKCKWVQVSPRVMSDAPAEWIIDDIEWVPEVGALPSIVKMELHEVKGQEGRECEVRAIIKNAGDKPLNGTAELQIPGYLKATGPGVSQAFGPLPPGGVTALKWRVSGLRDREDQIGLSVTGGAAPASSRLKLAPDLGEVWLETEQFILWPGRQTRVSLVVENNGTAAAKGLRASLRVPGQAEADGPTSSTLDLVMPNTQSRLGFSMTARKQTPSAPLTCAWETADGKTGEARAEIVVGAKPPVPASPPKDAARISCATFEIIFPRNEFGYGIGWIFTRPEGKLVGAMPYLGRAALKARDGRTIPLFADRFKATADVKPLGARRADLEKAKPRGLTFAITSDELKRLGLPGPITVSLAAMPGANADSALGRTITYQIACRAPKAPVLLALEGPMLFAGEGAPIGERDEALYPGLEWLVSGEESSSTLDIAADHPHRIRYVAHPHMVTIPLMAVRTGKTCVGLLWNERSAWNDGSNRKDLTADESDTDRPSAVFASPDRFDGRASHAMGLFVPTVPAYVEPNERVADKPWPAAGVRAKQVRLVSAIYINPNSDTAMDAMRAWCDIYGVAPPRKLPHAVDGGRSKPASGPHGFRGYDLPTWAIAADRKGSWTEPTREQWIDEIEWSAQAYLKTLWDDEENGWLAFKGGPALMQHIGPHAQYLYDCVVAAELTDDAALRKQLQDRIALIERLYPSVTPGADDLGFNFGEPVRSLLGLSDQAAGVARSQDPGGGWRFHPFIGKGGVFKGRDYRELGYEGQEAIGLVARKAWTMLRLSRMTGDQDALEAGLKALRYMDKFVVPRAAQVWEVPVHTPDILASSDACEAYLEAYRITGDRQWLDKAIYWEETGLPFLYQWDVDEYPWMRYGSIPVFGASWFYGSWFGRPVQWNGLRWAFAALKLAEVDDTYPWRMLAAGVTISAIYQQGDGENDLALWPDSISAIDAHKAGWIFAPRSILKNVYKMMGYEPEPVTARVEAPGGAVLINACGRIRDAQVQGKALTFTVAAPEPLPTRIVVCSVAEPKSVLLNGNALARKDALPSGETVGWTYDQEHRILEISPGRPGEFAVQVAPIAYSACRLAPPEADAVAFEFDKDDGYWRASHDLTPLSVAGRMLVTQATGGDPYMVRTNCRINGDAVSRIHVRMAVSAGTGAQWFWTTEDSPVMAEDKAINISIQGDGQFHDYYFDVGKHEMWRGKTITSIRLDPMAGADAADIKIDFIRGEK